MRTGHLFAGGGGGLYADLILGHTPIFAVEWDAYACAILRSRAADGWFPGLRVHEGDVRLFDPSEYAGRVDCLHAGFPCQDISVAGGGEGINGARSGLYRQVLRVADAIHPRYLFLENVGAIVGRGLGIVLGDLAARGYHARWTCLSAAEVGAPHKRDRWWCLGHTNHAGQHPDRRQGQAGDDLGGRGSILADAQKPCGIESTHEADASPGGGKGGMGLSGSCSVLAQSRGAGLAIGEGAPGERPQQATAGTSWWDTEPDVGRVAHGVAHRSHQIRALGNGQVPLCAAAAWKILGGP